MPTIEEEIQQPSFQSPGHRVQVNVIYTAAWINQRTTSALRPFGLSVQQFNILRILRGRGGKPATVKLLTERMIDKMSNASRLVDKLKEKGFVRRQECEEDRRRVDIVITQRGLEITNKASEAVTRTFEAGIRRLSDMDLDTLSNLLDKMRG